MYLLDTDVLGNLMKRTPAGELVTRLARVAPEEQFTSSVTLGELLYGGRTVPGVRWRCQRRSGP